MTSEESMRPGAEMTMANQVPVDEASPTVPISDGSPCAAW